MGPFNCHHVIIHKSTKIKLVDKVLRTAQLRQIN